MAPTHKKIADKIATLPDAWRQTIFHTITYQLFSHTDLFHQKKEDNGIGPVGVGECLSQSLVKQSQDY